MYNREIKNHFRTSINHGLRSSSIMISYLQQKEIIHTNQIIICNNHEILIINHKFFFLKLIIKCSLKTSNRNTFRKDEPIFQFCANEFSTTKNKNHLSFFEKIINPLSANPKNHLKQSKNSSVNCRRIV